MNIQDDLQQRKNEIAKISAYSSLRNGISFLIKLKKIAVLIAMLILIIIAFQYKNTGETVFQIIITLGSTAISLVLLSVIEDFLNALIDGIDLQLLANRRNELDRKYVSINE